MANGIVATQLRNRYRRSVPQLRTEQAYLGDGRGNVYADNTREKVYVRTYQPDGTLSIEKAYRYAGLSQFAENVLVQIEYADGLALVRPAKQEVLALAGVAPDAVEKGNVVSDAEALAKLLPFYSLTPTTSALDFTVIAVTGGYVDRDGTLSFVPNVQIDVSSEATSAGEHKVMLIAIANDNTLEVGSSTAQPTAQQFDLSDYQEARDAIAADSIPVAYWRATENTGTRVAPGSFPNGDYLLDARLLQNAAGGHIDWLGNPNPVTKAETAGSNRQVIYHEQLDIESSGSLDIGTGSQVVIL